MIILDTDHLTLLAFDTKGAGKRLRDRLETVADDMVATTIITYEEQTRGWLAYQSRQRSVPAMIEACARLARHVAMYRSLRVLDFDQAAAHVFIGLRRAQRRIGTMDLKIAAIAISQGAILLSVNRSDFGLIDGLRLEDWTH